MKENYKAWDIHYEDFDKLSSELDKLRFLLKFAVIAPSSHNTQPWSFSVAGSTIHIYRAPDRRLPIADPIDRQLFISIGCAIQNILIAADYYGYSTKIKFISEDRDDHLIAIIELKQEKKRDSSGDHLVNCITRRRTNRNRYKLDPIDKNILQELRSLEIRNTYISIISQNEKMAQLSDVAVLASIESLVDTEFRRELSHHVKHNMTNSKVGMPGFSLGIPTPVSFLLPLLIRLFNMEKAARKQNEFLFKKHTPYIVVIMTDCDERKNWLEAGQLFEQFALVCTKHGISVSPWGAPIQVGEFHKNLQEILKTKMRPQIFFRMGYATKPSKHTPRIPNNEVLKLI